MNYSSTIPPSSSPCTKDVFDIGNDHPTKLIKIEPKVNNETDSICYPPKPLLIGTPSDSGVFPVLILLHGFNLSNSFYSQLIQHIASHGFIVIAPQLYWIKLGTNANKEIETTAVITNWLSDGLSHFLPHHVQPDLTKLALAGHSRGGKVAFALALRQQLTSLKFSALIGIDPVDGTDKGKQTPPPVLTNDPNSFNLDMAVMVIGSGLGEMKKNFMCPPGAPNGVNFRDFYNECQKPKFYFVVKDYGHLDMLDDEMNILGILATQLCKAGESRKPMRRFVGGVVIAFLKGYLGGDMKELMAIIDGKEKLPIELQESEFHV